MTKRITIIDGHPDPDPARYVHALAEAYAAGAAEVGHQVRRIAISAIDIPFLRSQQDWREGVPGPDIAAAQDAIGWAEHIVLLYPLWLGDVPALLKAFLEQVARPGFALEYGATGPRPLLKGRTAHVVVTMGMPGFVYRLVYGAHSLKSLRRNILNTAGIRPVNESVIGMVEGDAGARAEWLVRMRDFGAMGC
ncbi:NAD(P)H-dependent oxidoreductase [Sphingomonas sp. CJ20]